MRGLALEAGGARGAYHIGAVRAFLEHGFEFDGFVGTSIGAINAAMFAQGDFEKAWELWETISVEQVFDVDVQHIFYLSNLRNLRSDKDALSDIVNAFAMIVKGRGVNTSKIKAFLESYIDEDKVRGSGKDFGLVTVSIDERRPYELMLDDIPEGFLVDYIMASASLPGFQAKAIGERRFIDGALYNSCPVNLLSERGYDEIVAVRTYAPGFFRRIDCSSNVTVVAPSGNLGNILSFSRSNSESCIRLGYQDGLSILNNGCCFNVARPRRSADRQVASG